MKIIVDKSIADLGKKSIVIAIAKNVDPAAKLSEAFLEKQKKMEEWALNCDAEEAARHPVNQGYIDSITAVGRSTKKNPPTAVALIQNIKRRGSIPGIRTDKTEEYMQKVLNRLVLPGSLYLAIIAVIPTVIQNAFGFPQSISMLMGGTSLLILVGVDLDTMSQIEALLKMHHHDGLVKKGRLRSRNL